MPQRRPPVSRLAPRSCQHPEAVPYFQAHGTVWPSTAYSLTPGLQSPSRLKLAKLSAPRRARLLYGLDAVRRLPHREALFLLVLTLIVMSLLCPSLTWAVRIAGDPTYPLLRGEVRTYCRRLLPA